MTPAPDDRAELLPCPFCGRTPKMSSRAAAEGEFYGHDDPSKTLTFISCMCGGYSARAHQYGPSEAEAIARWNTRAATTARAAGYAEGIRDAAKVCEENYEARHTKDMDWHGIHSELRIYYGDLAAAIRSLIPKKS
jgi:Lar family restriction alleviation protein